MKLNLAGATRLEFVLAVRCFENAKNFYESTHVRCSRYVSWNGYYYRSRTYAMKTAWWVLLTIRGWDYIRNTGPLLK